MNKLPVRNFAAIIAQRYILVPDCDDDRTVIVYNPEFRRNLLNPRHKQAQANVYGSGKKWDQITGTTVKVLTPKDFVPGWHPAITLKIKKDGTRSELPWEDRVENERSSNPVWYPAGVWAYWRRSEDGTNKIAIWGGDDTSYERTNLTDKKAETIWAFINDFVTLKTLLRLGFSGT